MPVIEVRPDRIAPVALDEAAVFSMRDLPLLTGGTTTKPLLKSSNLMVTAKVYANGGENDLHAHKNEDHAFFVLCGAATFYDLDDQATDVGPLEGIAIPREVAYRFQSTGAVNLVMLRISGWSEKYRDLRSTHIGADGKVYEGKDPKTGGSRGRVPEPSGELFGVGGRYLS